VRVGACSSALRGPLPGPTKKVLGTRPTPRAGVGARRTDGDGRVAVVAWEGSGTVTRGAQRQNFRVCMESYSILCEQLEVQ
jgi:hypothetical protein